jgi:lambda repressor-like predicted transcriptional regulator
MKFIEDGEHMSQKAKIIKGLKMCLKDRGMTYAILAKKIEVSEVTLKKSFLRKGCL